MKLVNIGTARRVVYLFTRDNGVLNCKIDKDFYPYYYEPDSQGKFFSYDGQSVRKIFVPDPSEIKQRATSEAYESDISLSKRYMIDKVKEIEYTPLRIMWVDIEVLAKNGVPDVYETKDPVTCVVIHDSLTNKPYWWYIEEFMQEGVDIKEAEKILLDKVISFISENTPDVLVGWNFVSHIRGLVGFDYPYLVNRIAKILKRDFSREISPVKYCRPGDSNIWYPVGISIIDYMSWFKKTYPREGSYALNNIAMSVLGEQSWKETEFGILSKDIIDKCKNDVRRMVDIEKTKKIFTLYNQVRMISKTTFEDLYYNSRVLDSLFLEEAKEKNIILPKKQGYEVYDSQLETSEKEDEEDKSKDFQGATRDLTVTGLMKSIFKYDLGGAYPSIIRDFCLDSSNFKESSTDKTVTVKIKDRLTGEIKNTYYIEQNDQALLSFVARKLLKLKAEYKSKIKQAKDKEEKEDADSKHSAIKTIVNCFCSNTKVLTKEGMKYIKDIRKGEKIYNVNPQTLKIEIDEVLDTQEYIYDGELYHYYSNTVDELITPEHRFLIREKISRDEYSEPKFKTISELYSNNNRHDNQIPKVGYFESKNNNEYISLFNELANLNGEIYIKHNNRNNKILLDLGFKRVTNKRINCYSWYIIKTDRISENKIIELYRLGYQLFGKTNPKYKLTPLVFKKQYFYNFLGWYISEGSIYKTEPKKYLTTNRGISYIINITQSIKNINNRKEIIENLKNMNIDIHKYSLLSKDISFSSELIYKYLEKECGNGVSNKKVPKDIFAESILYRNLFFQSLYKGDGTTRQKQYNTVSYKLATDVCQLLILNGNNNTKIKKEINSKTNQFIYRITWNNENKGISRENIFKKYYSGKVYCITTKNGNVFAGRNDKLTLTGQSAYGVFGCEYFRLYDKRAAETTTFLIRDLLTYVKNRLLEENKIETVYWDTDSIFCKDTEPRPTLFNQYIQDWAKQYGKESIELKFEYEGYFTKLFLSGKCRYKGYILKAGATEESEETRGLETKRNDSSDYTKDFQAKLLDLLFEEKQEKEVVDWVISQIDSFRTLSPTAIGFPCKINKEYTKTTPVFVKALENTKEILPKFNKNMGDKFYYIYIKPIKNKIGEETKYYYGIKRVSSELVKSAKDRKDYNTNLKIDHIEFDGKTIKCEDFLSKLKEKKIDLFKTVDVLAFDNDNINHIKNINWSRMLERNVINKCKVIFDAMKWDMSPILDYVDKIKE